MIPTRAASHAISKLQAHAGTLPGIDAAEIYFRDETLISAFIHTFGVRLIGTDLIEG